MRSACVLGERERERRELESERKEVKLSMDV